MQDEHGRNLLCVVTCGSWTAACHPAPDCVACVQHCSVVVKVEFCSASLRAQWSLGTEWLCLSGSAIVQVLRVGEAALGRLPSPTLRKRPPPPSLPLLSLPDTGPPSGTVCEGQACGRPRGCGCGGDVGMKVSGGEGAGPAGPVWQTLKGLSSRESSCGSPTSPGPQQQQQLQQQQRGLQSSNAVAERLARRDSCPLDASSSSSRPKEVTLPHLILPEGDRSPVLYNGSVATPVSAPPITASGDVGGRTPWGPPSSSTTSTSLSNTNLTLHKNAAVTPNNMLLTNNNIGNATTTSPKDDETPTADTPEAETPSVFR
ncbi:hypothetical protein E2C01_026806 [Portunus trituberculatus]|uniref:Uncharacterized protein n=1 Tax=Portunus trituberculatus TaxID=210409 RepID=A0A5B7EJT1_PORTR|nr:hypothetical protein [Portunus trituberculatus]